MIELVLELFRFVRKRKKYWLLPAIILLVLLGYALVAAEGSIVSPFIYTLF